MSVRYVLDLACDPAALGRRLDVRRGRDRDRFDGRAGGSPPSGDGTTIDYRAALDVKAPLPGFILRRVTDGLVAASLPNMFTSIEREVRKRQASAANVGTAGVEEAQLARRPGAGVVDADARRAARGVGPGRRRRRRRARAPA